MCYPISPRYNWRQMIKVPFLLCCCWLPPVSLYQAAEVLDEGHETCSRFRNNRQNLNNLRVDGFPESFFSIIFSASHLNASWLHKIFTPRATKLINLPEVGWQGPFSSSLPFLGKFPPFESTPRLSFINVNSFYKFNECWADLWASICQAVSVRTKTSFQRERKLVNISDEAVSRLFLCGIKIA